MYASIFPCTTVEALGVPIPEGGPASFTFRDLLMWGLEDHAEEVENITAMAQREYTMLSGLREMKSEMDRMVFDIIPYKASPMQLFQSPCRAVI